MAIAYSGEGADLRAAEVANPLLHTLLVDTTDLYQVGMVNLGDGAGSGSDTDNIGQIDLDDPMTAPAEGASVAATDPATSSVQVSIARQALRRDITDLFAGTGAPGMAFDPATIARDAANSIVIRRTALITALFPSISNSVGATGVDMDLDDFYDAIFQLQNESNIPGFFCTLYTEQLNNLMSSLRGETGSIEYMAATAAMLAAHGPGFAGSLLGVNIWKSDQVQAVNTGADSAGCMWSLGAFGYKEASIGRQLAAAGTLRQSVPEHATAWIEIDRDTPSGVTQYVYNYYTGVVEIEDARAVQIVTDR